MLIVVVSECVCVSECAEIISELYKITDRRIDTVSDHFQYGLLQIRLSCAIRILGTAYN